MSANPRKKKRASCAKIDGDMTIYTAAELKPTLLSLLEGGNEAELDLSRVAEIDAAGVQLLMLAKREAARAGKTLRFVNHSQSVVECLDLCNLTAAFGDQVILTSQP
ncbi:MAG: STAS domain-containing protein [Pseudomonadota bacterium]